MPNFFAVIYNWHSKCIVTFKMTIFNRPRDFMSESNENRTLRYAMLAVFIGVPLANFGLEPLLSDGNQFADDAPTRVSAAGYAFAIWGVIFTGMLWFAGAIAFGSEPDTPPLRKAIVCLIIAGLASIAFVPISIYCSDTIGWFDIMAHLIPLGGAAFYLRKHVAAVSLGPSASALSRWSFFGPSMYFGWISAATVISTSLMANEWGIELGDDLAMGLSIATLLGLAVCAIWMTRKRDPIYGATVCWALIAVGVKQEAYPAIGYVAWGGAVLVGLVTFFQLWARGGGFYPVTAGQKPADTN
jgi:hypothetical protein